MTEFAATPTPPYYAVIFTSLRTYVDRGYAEIAEKMLVLSKKQSGCLGVEMLRDGDFGITISYWDSLQSIRDWKQQADHLMAQKEGRRLWYQKYQVRICRVERDHGFELPAEERP